MRVQASALLLLTMLGACSSAGQMSETVTPSICPDVDVGSGRSGRLDGLMRYADRIRALDSEGWRREYEATRVAFARDMRPVNRFRFAVLLMSADSPYRNDALARELIAAFMENRDGDADYRHFGTFLIRIIDERHMQAMALDNERKQHQLLRKQLDELKAIETHMNRQSLTEQE